MNIAAGDQSAESGESDGLPSTLTYATAYAAVGPRHGTRVWAGLAITFGGLALIVLGGCFMMGIMALTTDAAAFGFKNSAAGPPVIGPSGYVLMIVLYGLALACFAGAAVVIFAGIRGLYGVLRAGP